MVLTPEFFGIVRRGAFDHWKGETVPVRGPDRRIIGEAKIVSVDHREDGQVWVMVESELDSETLAPGLRGIAELVRGGQMPTMSFGFRRDLNDEVEELMSEAYRPRRGDDVARWLKRQRDRYAHDAWDSENYHDLLTHNAFDEALDEYRARADYGLTLDADLSELPDGY